MKTGEGRTPVSGGVRDENHSPCDPAELPQEFLSEAPSLTRAPQQQSQPHVTLPGLCEEAARTGGARFGGSSKSCFLSGQLSTKPGPGGLSHTWGHAVVQRGVLPAGLTAVLREP